jgi:hypothetical protein
MLCDRRGEPVAGRASPTSSACVSAISLARPGTVSVQARLVAIGEADAHAEIEDAA